MSEWLRKKFEEETGIAPVFANRIPYINYINWLEEMKAKEIYDFIRNNPAKELKSVELIENYAELLKEDIECVHLFLNEYDIPTEDNGKPLSMVGRIKKLVEKADGTFFG